MDQTFEIKLFWALWSFVLLSAGSVIMTLLCTWAKRKVFGPPPAQGGSNSGKLEKKLDELIKAVQDNGRIQEQGFKKLNGNIRDMHGIVTKTDDDGVPKIHNKPSVEKVIRKIWAKVSGGMNGG